MSTTYEPISSVTLTSAAASHTFTSIPGTFTDLVIVISSYTSNTSGAVEGVRMRFNSDSGSNYSNTRLTGDGSSAASTRRSNETLMTGPIQGDSSGPFSVNVFHFMSYANTSVYKTVLMGSSAATDAVYRVIGLWRSTSAITSIEVFPSAGNFVAGSTLSLYGIKSADLAQGDGVQATGGDEVYFADGYKYHVFKSSGSLVVSQGGDVEYLVVAGGGGGGGPTGTAVCGGGGAGGVLSGTTTLSASSFSIVVGAGGASEANGSNSSFNSVITTGGGHGAFDFSSAADNGGSGGGGNNQSSIYIGGSGIAGQGFDGGDGATGVTGGGGGAGAVGADGVVGSSNGVGGDGISSSITGNSLVYGGGGGGGGLSNTVNAGGAGGSGGGGKGGDGLLSGSVENGENGTSGLGGGGGGGGRYSGVATGSGGAGGSGVVIVRYPA